MESPVRLGQELSVRVTYVREDGRLNASTKPIKSVAMERDAQRIWEYLQSSIWFDAIFRSKCTRINSREVWDE